MKKTFLLILCCIAILPTSCSLNDDSVKFHFVSLRIVDAEFPESFRLNETYNIGVTYVIPNNCVFFEGFDISNIDVTSRNIVAIGSEREEVGCNLASVEVEGSFDFTCLYEGTYYFRLWTGEDQNGEQQYLEFAVPVVQ